VEIRVYHGKNSIANRTGGKGAREVKINYFLTTRRSQKEGMGGGKLGQRQGQGQGSEMEDGRMGGSKKWGWPRGKKETQRTLTTHAATRREKSEGETRTEGHDLI